MALVNVILITKYRYKKTSQVKNWLKMGVKCEVVHAFALAVCWVFVIYFAINICLDFSWCDLEWILFHHLFLATTPQAINLKIYTLVVWRKWLTAIMFKLPAMTPFGCLQLKALISVNTRRVCF